MEVSLSEQDGIRLAIEGCGHGTLHAIYASVEEARRRKGWPDVDLLIIGGDFQSVRNAYDLNCVSMPAKYRSMCDFHEYYSGQRTAPCLTVFVGGNHEASNYLFELYYGGWVAPNIYYVGAANVLRLGPLRIAGMSGIWKGYNYRKPHHERLPYNESDIRSIYHTREVDVRKLLQIRTQIDIGISHDWPKGIEWKGDWKRLFRHKGHLEEDAREGQLGSVAAQYVMDRLRPRYWFSAHLHCKYAAVVDHVATPEATEKLVTTNGNLAAKKNDEEIDLDEDLEEDSSVALAAANADEIDLELEDDTDGAAIVAPGQGLVDVQVPVEPDAPIAGPTLSEEEARAALPEAFRPRPPPTKELIEHPPGISNTTTHFLALDKCLPNKDFLQLTLIPSSDTRTHERPFKLTYDREWLAITRAFALSEPAVFGDPDATIPRPKPQAAYSGLIDQQTQWLDEHLADQDMAVPDGFEVIAPVYDNGNWNLPQYSRTRDRRWIQRQKDSALDPAVVVDSDVGVAEEATEDAEEGEDEVVDVAGEAKKAQSGSCMDRRRDGRF
ncbi:lariat debranching enzyme [Friedmanniomyces endolithicus]|uniref:Lariat debranching enzyme n=1 Tax=Friedmanniomyces endolithicus TaxID=329885 RepID=A0AAN6KSL2_9PEZI|nr:lariat debranching enzyme [Friedmanniomyces endolithicus]KAK0297431.1 lariat debranching enzyme [Friedmanniomyces endolithicus]KAK0828592.1 lariat debranching enzyme [Friedmanniomyces endolithicus]KAK0924397.1 lariat debranching enzyme [Friedmanniomyces endolithicus]KAK0994404.1 lariat debranching enzyme [Friedmanniomyces endolithicus]